MRRRGFTLIELLVVIGIVAVLIGIAAPAAQRAVRASRATVCQSNLRQIGQGLLMYVGEHRGRLPWVVEPLWRTDGTLDFDADPSAAPDSMERALRPYVSNPKVYLCPSPNLGYPALEPRMTYRVSSANNFDGQPRRPAYLTTPAGPRYEHSLKYLNGRVYRLEYVDSSSYPFRMVRGVGPFYVARDFVSRGPSGEFTPPHPMRRFNQLRLDLSVSSERDARFAFTFP